MARKPIATTAFLILFIYAYFFWPGQSRTSKRLETAPDLHSGLWTYNFTRDADNHGLSQEQCDIAFPDLYEEIESARSRFKQRRIRESDLKIKDDSCLVRILIYDSEIFLVQGGSNDGCWISNWHERLLSFLLGLHRAIVAVEHGTIPNIEFVVAVDDDPHRASTLGAPRHDGEVTVWGWTRKPDQQNVWVVPDYTYWAWPSSLVPSYPQIRRKMQEANALAPWEEKVPKAVWRGLLHINPDLRQPLLDASENQPWGDVKICDEHIPSSLKYCIRPEDHCKYMFPIHTEGYTYSGRLKYMQLCNSAVVVHQLKWIEHHTHLLQPEGSTQNYIPVRNDWSDLEDQVQYYLKHQDEAQAIARNSLETFHERYLTPAAASCAWRRLFDAWASVQDFEPQLYTEDSRGKRKLRGLPFEEWTLNVEHRLPDN